MCDPLYKYPLFKPGPGSEKFYTEHMRLIERWVIHFKWIWGNGMWTKTICLIVIKKRKRIKYQFNQEYRDSLKDYISI